MLAEEDVYYDTRDGQTVIIESIDDDANEVTALVCEVQEGLDRDVVEHRVAEGELKSYEELAQDFRSLGQSIGQMHGLLELDGAAWYDAVTDDESRGSFR